VRAAVFDRPGGAAELHLGEVPEPLVGAGDVLIRVAGAGVNRADILQRAGFYPPPPGASEVLGLEVSGVVVTAGAGVSRIVAGERVMALIEGGGYAELARAPEAQVVPIPDGVDLVAAGGIPEVFITAHDNLFTRAHLHEGECVLVHGGAGGVGTAAVQLAARAGAIVVATAGSRAKLDTARELGATHVIDHREEDFVARLRDLTGGRGADVILDVMGAAYLDRNIEALAPDGRLVVIGMQGGTTAELDLGALMRRRGALITTAVRSRPPEQKAAMVAAFAEDVIPQLASGVVHPVIDRVLPLEEAAEAHRALESGGVIGKVVLRVDATAA
jgi:putative PIG3 family NAD(P)H quinone oxidoreductase